MIDVTDRFWKQHSENLTLKGELVRAHDELKALRMSNLTLTEHLKQNREKLTKHDAAYWKARAEAAEKERDELKAALERRGEIVFGKEGD